MEKNSRKIENKIEKSKKIPAKFEKIFGKIEKKF